MIVCVLLLSYGCVPIRGVKAEKSYREGGFNINKIAIIPFQKVVADNPFQTFVRCPISGAFLRTCELTGAPEKTVEEIFVNRIKATRKYIIIPPSRVDGIYKRVSAASFKEMPWQTIKKVGEELGVDGVIVGYVYCYMERKGYTYSVEQPASVTFCVHLLDVQDGSVMWSGSFDKTQRSLMENLLNASSFFRGGGKWVTARELSEEGVAELLKIFPGLE